MWKWRSESSSCPLGFITYVCDVRVLFQSVFPSPFLLPFIDLRAFWLVLFYLIRAGTWVDATPWSNLIESTRAWRIEPIFVLGEKLCSCTRSKIHGGGVQIGLWFLGNSFSPPLWSSVQNLSSFRGVLIEFCRFFRSLPLDVLACVRCVLTLRH